MEFQNHLKIDSYQVVHRDKNVTTNLNSDNFRNFINDLSQLNFRIEIIPPGMEHRADLISNNYYGTPMLDWLVCWYNNINDPFEQLNAGDQIKIPLLQ